MRYPQRYWSHLGRAQYIARLYADAIQSFSKLTPLLHYAFRAASPAQLGNSRADAAHAREVIPREPAFTAEGFLGTINNIRIKSTSLAGLYKRAYRPDSIGIICRRTGCAFYLGIGVLSANTIFAWRSR
jgi:hypothetical protein